MIRCLTRVCVSILLVLAMLLTLAGCDFVVKKPGDTQSDPAAETETWDVDEEDDPTPSEGLAYTLSDDGTYYILSGIGTCVDTDIVIPARYDDRPVREIGFQAFQTTVSLLSVTIGRNVTHIRAGAFEYCTNLTTVTFAERSRLEHIGDNAFFQCYNLTGIAVPDGVTYIGQYAFQQCFELRSVTFGEGSRLTTIGPYAFSTCMKLSSFVFPQGVTYIADDLFYRCDTLAEVTIPEGVTTIGYAAFMACSGLVSIRIPDSVTAIGHSAFMGCGKLASVTVPDSVTYIGSYAFAYCSRLSEIIFSGSKDAWGAIEKQNGWDNQTGAYIVGCTDGLIYKTT